MPSILNQRVFHSPLKAPGGFLCRSWGRSRKSSSTWKARMEVRVEVPADWYGGMVVVPKKYSTKVCLCGPDRREWVCLPWKVPSFISVIEPWNACRGASKLDSNMGFWYIPLTEESVNCTTFITFFGRIYFNLLPFGIASAPEHFRCMAEPIEQLDRLSHRLSIGVGVGPGRACSSTPYCASKSGKIRYPWMWTSVYSPRTKWSSWVTSSLPQASGLTQGRPSWRWNSPQMLVSWEVFSGWSTSGES